MPPANSLRLDHPSINRRQRWIVTAIAVCTALVGVAAAMHYAAAGLALAHYDARAHVVVARRIFDSLMPGWQQIGAVCCRCPTS